MHWILSTLQSYDIVHQLFVSTNQGRMSFNFILLQRYFCSTNPWLFCQGQRMLMVKKQNTFFLLCSKSLIIIRNLICTNFYNNLHKSCLCHQNFSDHSEQTLFYWSTFTVHILHFFILPCLSRVGRSVNLAFP